jgi:hypothetical protein
VIPYWGGLDLVIPVERDLRHAGGDLFLDGSLGSHTAALCEPYTDQPATSGTLELDDDTLAEWFLEVVRAGMQSGVHAIGDAALRQVVRCWRRVAVALGEAGSNDTIRRGRHRIEHAEVLPPDLIDEVAEFGLVISAQPAFEQRWGLEGGMYASRLGPERVAWTNAYRALADHGIGVAFGSDSNVTPMDPWNTVHAAEQRHRPEHAVSRLEAVSMSTLGGVRPPGALRRRRASRDAGGPGGLRGRPVRRGRPSWAPLRRDHRERPDRPRGGSAATSTWPMTDRCRASRATVLPIRVFGLTPADATGCVRRVQGAPCADGGRPAQGQAVRT